MCPKLLLDCIEGMGIHFFTGVPDSCLKPFLTELIQRHMPDEHIIVPNEGTAVAVAAGYYLSQNGPACVYLQNSGLGNLVNPICSLTHEEVYRIPVLYVVGWRGCPGTPDEPQHIYQGKVTPELLRLLDIHPFVISQDTPESDLKDMMIETARCLQAEQSAALVICPGALIAAHALSFQNKNQLSREEAIQTIVGVFGDRVLFVSSTGKMSRELYEVRESQKREHGRDFLTVGSMGHCSAIACSSALFSPERQIVCLDGDGALLMHMGTLTMIGSRRPENLIHIVLDNESHESVGGMPTASGGVDLCAIARACGYPAAHEVSTREDLISVLEQIMQTSRQLTFLRIRVSIGSRKNLSRPRETPKENRARFECALRGLAL